MSFQIFIHVAWITNRFNIHINISYVCLLHVLRLDCSSCPEQVLHHSLDPQSRFFFFFTRSLFLKLIQLIGQILNQIISIQSGIEEFSQIFLNGLDHVQEEITFIHFDSSGAVCWDEYGSKFRIELIPITNKHSFYTFIFAILEHSIFAILEHSIFAILEYSPCSSSYDNEQNWNRILQMFQYLKYLNRNNLCWFFVNLSKNKYQKDCKWLTQTYIRQLWRHLQHWKVNFKS